MKQRQNFQDNAFQAKAVECPTCGAKPGTRCKRPSEHTTSELHADRKTFADTEFINLYGVLAGIDFDETLNRWGVRAAPNGDFIDYATMGGRKADQPIAEK
jgi:hypothetical protein